MSKLPRKFSQNLLLIFERNLYLLSVYLFKINIRYTLRVNYIIVKASIAHAMAMKNIGSEFLVQLMIANL